MSPEMSGAWLSFDWSSTLRFALDLGLAGLVGLLAWRLHREADPASDPDRTKAWDERERRLRELHESLRRLVAQAQEDARLLDARLAAQVSQVESTLRSAEAVIEAMRAPRVLRTTEPAAAPRPAEAAPVAVARQRPAPSAPDVASRVHALAEEAMTAEEIARQVDLPIADVRFLLALGSRGAKPVVEGVA